MQTPKLILILLCLSCHQVGWADENTSNLPLMGDNNLDTLTTTSSRPLTDYYWSCSFDDTESSEYLQRGALVGKTNHSLDELIDILNKRSHPSKLEVIEQHGDTLVVEISDDEELTENSGSTGALCFLAETVYTLTEIKGINFVDIRMNEGSHATPGVYSREVFKTMIRE